MDLFDLRKENCATGTQTRIADIDNRFCREIEKSFCASKVYLNTLYLDNTRSQWNNSAVVVSTIRVNALHILIALKYFTLVCNLTPVPVEMVNFAIVKVDNFCKNKLIAM